jgi:hypothetical protein
MISFMIRFGACVPARVTQHRRLALELLPTLCIGYVAWMSAWSAALECHKALSVDVRRRH